MTQMGWFFTKAALLTFGGAYAVLPYVFDGAVETHGWLTAAQMMDGLALGETTPGPLIMIVAFVGFVGAGVLGACVATWFTFLPSFVFIFLGAPLIETTHQQPRLTAPLTAITAAVVGVILNLALFFGVHTLWPQGFEWPLSWPVLWSLDWPAAGIAVGALIALVRYQRNVLEVIAVCALLGLLTHTALGAS